MEQKSFVLDSLCPTLGVKLAAEKVKKSEKVLNCGGGWRRNVASAWLGKADGDGMKYYAHTAEDEEDKPLPEDSGKWQLLSAHLRSVADLAKKFAAPLGLGREAELAGLLHDL